MKKKGEFFSFFEKNRCLKDTFKRICFILLVSIFPLANYAQDVTNQRFDFRFEDLSVKEVLEQIESKTSYVFLYQDYILDANKKVNYSFNNQPLQDVLKKIFDDLNLNYQIHENRQITLTQKPAAQTSRPEVKKDVPVSGIVRDSNNDPIPGATVLIKGSSKGTITDIDGNFNLTVDNLDDFLQFSFVGMLSQSVKIGENRLFNITLQEGSIGLHEVVAVGYGSMKKRDITGSIVSISNDAIEQKNATNIFDALQGMATGVQIISGSGQPGESSSIRIRGTSTFSADGVTPLYIVDGMPVESIESINPGDIESIEVLKDAASAAIYGSRSANGVIIISTKQGEAGKPTIDLKYSHSVGALSHKLPQANREDRRLYDISRKEFFETYGGGSPSESIMIIQDSLNVFFNVDNDYQDMITQSSRKDQVDLSVSGGQDKIKYYASTGFYNEKGIIPNTGFQRLTTRLNTDYSATPWFKLGNRISLGYSKKEGVNEGELFRSMLLRRPYFSTYYSDGSLVGVFNGQKNPIAQINYTTDFTEYYTTNFYQYFEVDILKDLQFRTNINANLYLNKRKRLNPSLITDEWQKSNSGASNNYLNWNWMNEGYFTYNLNRANHNLVVMAGYSVNQWRSEQELLAGINSSTDYIYTMNAFTANLDLGSTGTWEAGHSMASVFTRLTYDYLGRYLVTANVRRDGSSRFAPKNKWGTFPSVSVGWRFSDEGFMSATKGFLDDAKFRVSYGVTGNEAIGNYDYVHTYSPSGIYDGIGGVSSTRIQSDDLRWEETTQANAGLDLSFLESRLLITADYYDKYTDGLLANYQLPKESGFSYIKRNVGAMSNKGFEFSISGDMLRTKDWNWNASFNITHNANKIEQLSEGKAYLEGGLWWMEEGGKVGDFYGYKSSGVFQYNESNAFTSDWEQLTPVFENGVFQNAYELNGQLYTDNVVQKKLPNGKPFRGGDYNWEENEGNKNGVIDDNDKMIIGNALPDFTGGLNTQLSYKNLSLYVSFYYSFGGEIYNDGEDNRNSFKYTGTTPSPKVIHNMWLKPGDKALYPRPFNDEFNNARYANSAYIEDASFIRLQNVRLSYNMPTRLVEKINVKGIRLYTYVDNALTWTNYSGFDPEFSTSNPLQVGKDSYRYPRKREFGVGLNVNF